MAVTLARDLGQVGDAQDLARLAQLSETATHDFRDAAADARVDLVEDQTGWSAPAGRDDLDGERDTGEFAAGRNAGQRGCRLAGVGCHREFNPVEAMAREITVFVGGNADLEVPARHAELAHHGRDGVTEGSGRGGACPPEIQCERPVFTGGRLEFGGQCVEGLGSVFDGGQFVAKRDQASGQFRRGDLMLAGQFADAANATIDELEPCRVRFEPGLIAAQLLGRVVDLDLGFFELTREGSEGRVGLRQAREGFPCAPDALLCRAVFVVVDQLEGLVAAFGQPPGVRETS